jgi:hypothetical protein
MGASLIERVLEVDPTSEIHQEGQRVANLSDLVSE